MKPGQFHVNWVGSKIQEAHRLQSYKWATLDSTCTEHGQLIEMFPRGCMWQRTCPSQLLFPPAPFSKMSRKRPSESMWERIQRETTTASEWVIVLMKFLTCKRGMIKKITQRTKDEREETDTQRTIVKIGKTTEDLHVVSWILLTMSCCVLYMWKAISLLTYVIFCWVHVTVAVETLGVDVTHWETLVTLWQLAVTHTHVGQKCDY